MTRSFAATLRRASRLTPARMTAATHSIHQAMTSLMLTTALVPLTALTPRKAGAQAPAIAIPDAPSPDALTPKTPKSRSLAAKAAKPPRPKAGQALSSVLGQLRAAQGLVPSIIGGDISPAPAVPQGARFVTRRHRSAAGSRGYKLYVPAGHADQPRGLILMLHGCKQTPDDFALGTNMNALADTHGLVIAYPAQTRVSNAAACWNWFRPVDQRRGMGEPAILASLARKLTREFGLDRDAVFVAGLSAGGAMAVILADVYPDVFAAAGAHSGLARGAAHDIRSAISAMHSGGEAAGIAAAAPARRATSPARLIVFQGDADSTVHPSNAPMIVAAALGANTVPSRTGSRTVAGRGYTRVDYAAPDGTTRVESWTIRGAGHAWSGGRAAGSFTDRQGPDASAQMVRFFLAKSA